MTAIALPHEISAWTMFAHADVVVQSVIGLLILASVATWTVGLAKGLELRSASQRSRRGLTALGAANDLDEAADALDGQRNSCASFVEAAQAEIRRSAGTVSNEGIKERTAWQLERLAAEAGRRLGRGAGMLATIGATAPFIGLFGTVWGIMNAFIGISRAQTTNLAVVAPGISEALLATAIGLVAAIPAVIIYNLLARTTSAHRARMADAMAETMRLLSRDLDRVKPARLRVAGE